MKRKKQFAKGRTIISYSPSLCSKLLEMASGSNSPGMQSMPQLWQSHKHWARPITNDDVEWDGDLVGFFYAVPRKDSGSFNA